MKKTVKAAFCLSLVAILMVSLVACGGVAGRYNLVSMEMGETKLDIESLKAMAGTDVEMYIELNDDGTGVMNMDGETTQMAYADGKIWPVNEADDKVPFTVNGDTLTLEQDGIKMVFKK